MLSERVRRQVDRLLDEAEEAITRLDWQVVRDRAQAVLRLEPGNGDALAYLSAADSDIDSTGTSTPAEIVSASSVSAPLDSLPKSFADGRYRVEEFLGEGGMKRVYRARDTVLDRQVALGVIKAEKLDEVSRSRIVREVQALARLGDHPHIMQIHDFLEEDGQPYMVLPFMSGSEVEELIENAPDNRVPLEETIKIAADVCRGLEFAHSKGLVHRDLKPGNVWVTEDGTAKILDFGLAVAMDHNRLTQQGTMVGTFYYMPPEQALGSEVTPQADLYSLGAMLYEIVTGRPPFLGDGMEGIIGQHISTPPVAPIWHSSSCPKPLEALILRLLAKDPSERPDSAADVLTALESIDPTAVSDEAVSDKANVLDSLAGGVFVGRQREMDDLKATLEEALSGRGRMVTLVGEPGIGKTRTAEELETYAKLRGAQVLWGRCYEDVGTPPYWPWVQAIRSYVRDRDPEQLRSEMGSGAADIAEIVSDVRERLPDLKPAPSLEDPDQARFRLFDSIAAFLKGASGAQPMVVMLDDLHWADKQSLLLLEHVAREVSRARLLLIGTYRDVELNRRHPLAQTLGELTRERLFERVILRGLIQGDVSRFIEVATGLTPPEALVSAVYTQTEGNPLFVPQVVQLLVQEGELTPERLRKRESLRPGSGQAWTVRIPEGVREVIGRRLDRLSQRCNDTLTMASVIGRRFELAQLDRLIDDLTEERLLEVLEEALAARIIEELTDAMGRYQFTHAMFQETLVGELSLTRRVRLHARIAQTLEGLYGADADAEAVELAYHFGQAEAVLGSEKLVHYSLLAGDRALATYAWEEALAHFERARAAREGHSADPETAAIWFGLARAHVGTSRGLQEIQQAVDNLIRAFDYYVDAGDVPEALVVAQTWIFRDTGLRGLAEMLLRALDLAPPDSPVAARLLARYGRHLGIAQGDYEGTKEAIERAMAIAEREDDPALEMSTLFDSNGVELIHLHRQEALKGTLRVIELARELGDPVTELIAHWHAFRALVALGDPEAARPHADAVSRLEERVRSGNRRRSALHAQLSFLQGDWRAASRRLDRWLAARHAGVGYGHIARALVEYEVGAFAQGEAFLERATETPTLDLALGVPGIVLSLEALIARIAGVD